MLGDRDTVMGIKTRRHLKQKSFQECGFHLGGLGPDLFVNKNQELSVTGYNERGSFVPLLLDLWQAQLPGIRYFQAFPKSSNHRAKKPRHSRLPPARAREGRSHGIQFQWHREGNSHPRIESSRTRRRNVREGTF